MKKIMDEIKEFAKSLFSLDKTKSELEDLKRFEDDPVSQYVPPVENVHISEEAPQETCEVEICNSNVPVTEQSEEPGNITSTVIDIPIESVLEEDKKNEDETEPIIDIPVESVLKEDEGNEVSLCQEENGVALKLFSSFADLINEFDTYLLQTQNEETKQMIELCQYRLIESMAANGATPIDKDTKYNCLRHVPIPFSIVQDGMPITEVLRIGLEYNGRIVLKAKVRINQ